MNQFVQFKQPPSASKQAPLWIREPFRIFFPLGMAAAVFGLLLWPLHYAGWWETYPAIQHPRILILGFGAAFVFGFLGTAWPRFVEAPPLSRAEVIGLILLWAGAQSSYAFGGISAGDFLAAASCLFLIAILGVRWWKKGADHPTSALLIPFLNLGLVSAILIGWATGVAADSPQWQALFRLFVYQGFLLLPLLGVGSFFFPKFFDVKPLALKRRAIVLASVVLLILVSFVSEAWGHMRIGNAMRLGALVFWSIGAASVIWQGKAPGTRPWALRLALVMIAVGFACRIVWPFQVFAFEHLLFLGGFSQIMLLVADRVVVGHSDGPDSIKPKSVRWRWIVWLMILTAATRATADLVPSTRVSHHIYAAVMLVVILVLWWVENAARLKREEGDA